MGGGRKIAGGQQGLRPIEVGEDRVQQPGALNEAGLDLPPLVGIDRHRHEIELPRPTAGGLIERIGQPVLMQQAAGQAPATRQLPVRQAVQYLDETPPVRTDVTSGADHFVVSVGRVI